MEHRASRNARAVDRCVLTHVNSLRCHRRPGSHYTLTHGNALKLRNEGTPMTRKHAWFTLFTLILWSATVIGQNINTLTAQEKTQGWQLLFDGKTLKGWHSAAPPPAEKAGVARPVLRRRPRRRSPDSWRRWVPRPNHAVRPPQNRV